MPPIDLPLTELSGYTGRNPCPADHGEHWQKEARMAVGLMDQVCPPSSQFAACNRMSCPKSLVIYPDFAHEALPGIDDAIYEYFAEL